MLGIATNSLAAGRFVIDHRLGVGGMGSVYRAFDTKKSAYVALKSLGRIDADTVRAFKAEFREFQHLSHPSLVALDELFSEGDDWYFTMELVVGEDILSHVRGVARGAEWQEGGVTSETVVRSVRSPETVPSISDFESGSVRSVAVAMASVVRYPGSFDEARFAAALRQLAAGLGHLHLAGKVHCDVKSHNIIVCPDGRTVLLDFGIAVDVRSRAPLRAATPLYMAPELLREPATPAADWYAVGVLAYTAMTGADPWAGDFAALMEAKRSLPLHPRTFSADLPEPLAELALGLMHPDPRRRLGRKEVLEYLATSVEESRHRRSGMAPPDDDEIFVGRENEILLLRAAYDEMAASDAPVVVYVKGESGIGKSALVKEVAAQLEQHGRGEVTVLRGRVFEEEVVPYKSVDGVVDALVERFRVTDPETLARILPTDFSVVADTFPVLRSVTQVANLARIATPDPLERRAQMFAALKECLRRLAEVGPLVLTIDDLQWSDDDSLLLWNEILRPPLAPRMFVLATLRGERADSEPAGPFGSGISQRITDRVPSLPVPTETLWMRPLSEEESRDYVRVRLLTGGLRPDLAHAAEVIDEANGHPLFLEELLRYDGLAFGTGKLNLDRVLRERIEKLQPELRRYLEIVCIAAKPLPRTLVGTAAGLSFGDGLRAVKALRGHRLVKTARTPGIDGDDWVDPFHYRIRGACLDLLDEDTLAARHRAIAEAMEAEGKLDAEQLSVHFGQSGDVAKAAHYAEIAAHVAFEALGFRRASELYADAIGLLDPKSTRIPALRERLAISLKNAGKGKAAADQLLWLADMEDDRSFERRCDAAELLLRTGHVDEGTRVVERVLADAGESLATSDRQAWLLLIYRSIRLRARGVGWTRRSAADIPPKVLRSLDALWCFSVGHGPVDQLRAYACAAEHSLRALDVGEPVRVAKAFAMETLTAAAQGNGPLAERHSREAQRIVGTLGDSAAGLAIVPASRALSLMMRGDWDASLDAAVAAQAWIRAKATGAWGELAFAEEAELWSLASTGAFVLLVERQAAVVIRAHEQQDFYAGFAARSGLSNLAYLAADEPLRALAETESALSLWSTRGVHLQHLFDTLARAQAHLYMGDLTHAARSLSEMDEKRKERRILVPEPLTPMLADVTARVALARAFRGGSSASAVVKASLAVLESGNRGWTSGVAMLLRAGLAHAEGRREEAADHASSAGLRLRAAGMAYMAKIAALYTRRLGGHGGDLRLPGGESRVGDPVAFARTFIPGLAAMEMGIDEPS